MESSGKLRLAIALVLLVCAPLAFSACGSGGGDTGSTGGGETGGGETGGGETAEIVPAPPTEPPTEVPITKPLNKAPPNWTVAWMACELPICQEGLTRGWEGAAKALGWNLKQINYKALETGKFVQQALNENVDAIGITGIPPAAFEAQAKQAIKEGVPIASGSEITEPEPKVNGLVYQGQNQASVEEAAAMIANWSINDAGGKVNMASVTIEEYPILVAETEGLEAALGKCDECGELGKIPVTIEDVGEGRVPSKVAAYLQTHPEVNYLQFTFSDLALGVYDALKPLGLTDKVKIVGQNGNPTNMKEIVEGKSAIWTAQPQEYFMWLEADALARVGTGTPLEPYEEEGKLPYWVVEKDGAEMLLEKYEGNWPGPEGFEEAFEKVWNQS
jgi:ABC-type sugar transport system substrate-binding protein